MIVEPMPLQSEGFQIVGTKTQHYPTQNVICRFFCFNESKECLPSAHCRQLPVFVMSFKLHYYV